MSEQTGDAREIEAFISHWPGEISRCFHALYNTVRGLDEVIPFFFARPGISYSFRPKHCKQTARELFAVVDVIDDDPAERWLSVCFYVDMITDPEGRGEVIPHGLPGGDGYCFDVCEHDEALIVYLQDRLVEAWQNAVG